MASTSKDNLEEQIRTLENTVEGLHEHISMLQQDLYNEQLRNENLEAQALRKH
jgi:chaperonin cofactor prefoldin|tara:strand:+ start:353 stop:511 length:159 start_codon:yes stop_codon:yes gene_type:complete